MESDKYTSKEISRGENALQKIKAGKGDAETDRGRKWHLRWGGGQGQGDAAVFEETWRKRKSSCVDMEGRTVQAEIRACSKALGRALAPLKVPGRLKEGRAPDHAGSQRTVWPQ